MHADHQASPSSIGQNISSPLSPFLGWLRARLWLTPLALLSAFVAACGALAWPLGLAPTASVLFSPAGWLLPLCGLTLLLAGALALALYLVSARAASSQGRQLALAIPLALLAAYGMAGPTAALYVDTEYKGLLWGVCFVLFALALRKAISLPAAKGTKRAALLLGGLFAACMALGRQLSLFNGLGQCFSTPYALAVFGLEAAGLWVLFFALLLLAMHHCAISSFTVSPADRRGFFQKKRSIPLMAAAMLLCWLPYLIACYPGVQTPDTTGEISSMIWMADYSNHHPFIHQLTIKPFLMLGEAVGSLTVGCCCYSLFQMAAMALLFSYTLWLLARQGLKPVYRAALFGIYAFSMANAVFSLTMWKDVLFGGFTLLLTALLFRRAQEGETVSIAPKAQLPGWAGLTVVCFFFCVYRNNGYYAFLLAFPFFILCNHRRWKALCLVLLTTILLVSAYQALLFDVLGVRKSVAGEALSLPLQQIARTVTDEGDRVTEEEYAVLDEVFTDARRLDRAYDPRIADPVKGSAVFRSQVFSQNPLRYAKLWLQLGLKHPIPYVTAFLCQSFGYWYPDEYADVFVTGLHANVFGIAQNPQGQPARDAILQTFERQRKTPVLSLLYSIGLMAWLAAFAAALLTVKGRKRLASAMLPMAALWLTTLASPVYCEFRYLYGVIIAAPFCLGMALCSDRKKME